MVEKAVSSVTTTERATISEQTEPKTTAKKPAQLNKMDSLLNLREKESDISSEELESSFIDAMEKQGVNLSSFLDPRKKDFSDVIIGLNDLKEKVGIKEVKIKAPKGKKTSQERVYIIDFSWPAIKAYAERYRRSEGADAEKLRRLNTLMSILDKFEMAPSDRRKVKADTADFDKLCELCTGNEGAFGISKLTPEEQQNFKKILKIALGNYTGFQKIASALVIHILCFKKEFKNFEIVAAGNPNRGSYNSAHNTVRFSLESTNLENRAWIFIHELSHAFHDHLLGWLYKILEVNYSMVFVTRSIINSKTFDLESIFFPYFSKTKMDEVVSNIEKSIERLRGLLAVFAEVMFLPSIVMLRPRKMKEQG